MASTLIERLRTDPGTDDCDDAAKRLENLEIALRDAVVTMEGIARAVKNNPRIDPAELASCATMNLERYQAALRHD